MLVILTRNYTNQTLYVAFIVSLTDGKCIMWAGSCDLNEYSSTNFTIQVPKSLTSARVFAEFVSARLLINCNSHISFMIDLARTESV